MRVIVAVNKIKLVWVCRWISNVVVHIPDVLDVCRKPNDVTRSIAIQAILLHTTIVGGNIHVVHVK